MGSGGLFSLLRGASRIAQSAPTAARLAAAVARAREGDRDAIAYLKSQGWADALDVGVRPGAGEAARVALDHAREAYHIVRHGLRDDVIEGEAYEVDPWTDFVRHLMARQWGVVGVFGNKGEGKTTLAFKLAQRWQEKLGYRIEVCNIWKDDVPQEMRADVVEIDWQRLVARMEKVSAWLNQRASADDEIDDGIDFGEDDSPPISDREIDKMKRRIVIVDEVGMALSSLSAVGQQKARASAANLNNQARHLDSFFIFICQQMRQLPGYLYQGAIQFYKRPDPDAVSLDEVEGRQGLSRRRWADVREALTNIRQSPYFAPPYDDMRSWAYAVAHDLGGHGYTGVVPFTPVGYVPPEDDEAAA